MSDDVRQPLRGKLPMVLDKFPCPVCDSKVYLNGVTEWDADDGEIISAEFDCETEPDLDSPEWEDWYRGHFSMPYVEWLPWHGRVMEWLNRNYHYDNEEHENG